MYKCFNCGCVFDNESAKIVGDGFVEPKTISCPECGDQDFEEAEKCAICGEYHFESEMIVPVCEECGNKCVEEYRFNHIQELYLMASNEEEKVELNPLIASMFTPSQINEIFLNVLIDENKFMKVDCKDFIESDRYWFLDKVVERERG